ncbi:MAG: T9SS type A sorting domain-containing protein [Bacteroidia bacterium]|nr:T9SS type A sorting domain-containing protein [Bacteroidia bacterium]
MKKFILSTLALGAAMFAEAQTQRLVFVEEFTQASCGPCASQNPSFNALLAANTAKAVSLKYQTSWPGVDPMNAQNPTDVQTRVTYYNVTGVPHGRLDGPAIVNDCNAYTGAPVCLSQTEINNRYSTPAPFALQLTHVMSNDFDSAYVTVVITAAQAFTATSALKFHLAMVEKEIHFTTPPGSNGEKDFFMVMRKMYPNANGTTLGSTWTNAQTQTLNFAVAVPSYIYNINELAFVAFIQENNSTKDVHQSAYSAPNTIQFDAGVNSINNTTVVNCTGTYNLTATITNISSNNLTSVDVNYQLDANSPQVINWTGNLAPQAFANVVIPTINAGDGSHTLTVWTTNPNGGGDQYPSNDTQVYNFVVSLTPSSAPLTEGYENTTWPPSEWAVGNTDAYTWTRWTSGGGFGNSASSAKMDFFNAAANTNDELVAPMVDLSSNTTAASLTFNVAYAQYNTLSIDKLEVRVSTDCGATWTTVYSKSGSNLKTTNPQTAVFAPNATAWRNEIVNLNAFAGNNDVIIKFVGISNSGNNLYLDDINIVNSTGVEENTNVIGFNLYPNPSSGNANLDFTLLNEGQVSVEVYTVTGEKIISRDLGTRISGNVNLSNGITLPDGVYMVSLIVDGQKVTKLLTIQQ